MNAQTEKMVDIKKRLADLGFNKSRSLGLNPFNYTGIYFNKDGSKYAFITRETVSSDNWTYWEEIDSTRFHENDYFKQKYAQDNAEKCIPLSTFFSIYDWVKDDGYTNFKDWVEQKIN